MFSQIWKESGLFFPCRGTKQISLLTFEVCAGLCFVAAVAVYRWLCLLRLDVIHQFGRRYGIRETCRGEWAAAVVPNHWSSLAMRLKMEEGNEGLVGPGPLGLILGLRCTEHVVCLEDILYIPTDLPIHLSIKLLNAIDL